MDPQEQILEKPDTQPPPNKKKFINKFTITFVVLILLIIPFIIKHFQSVNSKAQPVNSSTPTPPHFAKTPPAVKLITVDTKALIAKYESANFDMDYDIYFDLAKGHYFLDLQQPSSISALNADMLVYDGKKIIDTNVRDFMLSKNGEHYAFTTVDEMTTGYPVEKITLYVDGKLYLTNQPNLKLIGISNDGKQIFYTIQPNNQSGKGGFYDAKKLIQSFSGQNYDYVTLLSDFSINSNGTFYTYESNGKTYVNGRFYRNTVNINPIVFSDDYKHFLYLEFHNRFPVGSDALLYVDNKYQFEGNMEYLESNTVGSIETNPEIDNNGDFALLDSDGAGAGTVYLQSKPYKLKGESDRIYFNPAQTDLLVHYMNGHWELDDKEFQMPETATSSAVELENNYLYIYNFMK